MPTAEQGITTDNVIAISAVIIALAALAVAVYEGAMSRRHNRLSVMPLLEIDYHLRGTAGYYGVSVANQGLGPALVTHCVLQVDGETMQEQGGDNGWQAARVKLGFRELKPGLGITAPNVIIPAGDTVWLLSAPVNEETERHYSELEAALRNPNPRLRITMSYESLYGDRKQATYFA
jgi:hypothetical protein